MNLQDFAGALVFLVVPHSLTLHPLPLIDPHLLAVESSRRACPLTHPIARPRSPPPPLVLVHLDGGRLVIPLSGDCLPEAGETAEAPALERAAHTLVASRAPLVHEFLLYLHPLLSRHQHGVGDCGIADLTSHEHVEDLQSPETDEQVHKPREQDELAKVPLYEVYDLLEVTELFANVYKRVVLVIGGRWRACVGFIPTLYMYT